MSIRPSEAAHEASRFSLRDALFGNALPAVTYAERTYTSQQATLNVSPASVSTATATVPILMQTGHTIPNGKPTITFNNMFVNNKYAERPAPKRVNESQNQCMTAAAISAISKIQEMQLKQKCAAKVSHVNEKFTSENKRLLNSNTNSRMLPSGYVSGGSIKTDPNPELLRLSGVVDSLNDKLKAQSHKLYLTEASLVKANHQITNERVEGQKQILKANDHIRKLTENESKLKSIATTIRDDQARSDETFKLSLKKFKESENSMLLQQQQLETASMTNSTLSAEVCDLKSELSRISTERDASYTALEEYTAKYRALEESSAQCDVSSDTLSTSLDAFNAVKAELEASKAETQCVRTELESKCRESDSSFETLVQERDSMKIKLDEVTKSLGDEVSALKSENYNIDASATSAVSEKHAMDCMVFELKNKLCDTEKHRDDALKLLSSSRRALQTPDKENVDVKKLASDLAVTQSTLRESERDRLNMSNRISMLETEMGSTMTGQLKLKTLKKLHDSITIYGNTSTSTTPYTPNDAYVKTQLKTRSSLDGRPISKTQASPKSFCTTMFERENLTGTQTPVGLGLNVCVANDPSSYANNRFVCNGHTHGRLSENILFRDKALTTSDKPKDSKVLENLVIAVSKDVTSAIIDARRSYMIASGVDEKDADQQLMPFAIAPIGNEDEGN